MSDHPFADLIDMRMEQLEPGASITRLDSAPKHLNTNNVVHGAVLYALADTGMGCALFPMLEEGQICATVEIKMNYFKPVFSGHIVCRNQVINRGKKLANIDSRLYVDDVLVAQANGTYAIFRLNDKTRDA